MRVSFPILNSKHCSPSNLKPSVASSTPLSVLIVHVFVSVGLYFSKTSTPTTTGTTINTESSDRGNGDVDDEDDTRKFEDEIEHND